MVERTPITRESLQVLSEDEELVLNIIKELNAIEGIYTTMDIITRQTGREGISERKTKKIIEMLVKLYIVKTGVDDNGALTYIDKTS